MSPVAAPSDKRFRRAHVKPGRRRRWRSVLWPLARYGAIAVLVMGGVYRAGIAIAHADALRIGHIEVRGNSQLSSAAIVGALRELRGENILRSDLAAWRLQLLASPWVKDAAMRRVLPSTVEVVVQEREPVGLGRIDGLLYLVGEDGVIIDQFGPKYTQFDLPIVDGLQASPKGAAPAADPVRAALAAQVILSLRSDPDVAGRLSQVDVTNVRNAGVILSGDPAMLYVGTDRFLPRVQSYLQLAEAMNERVPGIDAVDLRFDKSVFVQLAGKAGRRNAAKPAGQLAPGPAANSSGTGKKR